MLLLELFGEYSFFSEFPGRLSKRPRERIPLALVFDVEYSQSKSFIGRIEMLDFPELLIIVLTVVLVFLSINHWISTIALDRSRTKRKE